MRALGLQAHLQLRGSPQMQITDGGRIRLYREARKISLREMGKALGCSHTQVAKYESGKTPNISEDRARMISLMTGLPMASVFRLDEGFVLPETSSGACSDGLRATA